MDCCLVPNGVPVTETLCIHIWWGLLVRSLMLSTSHDFPPRPPKTKYCWLPSVPSLFPLAMMSSSDFLPVRLIAHWDCRMTTVCWNKIMGKQQYKTFVGKSVIPVRVGACIVQLKVIQMFWVEFALDGCTMNSEVKIHSLPPTCNDVIFWFLSTLNDCSLRMQNDAIWSEQNSRRVAVENVFEEECNSRPCPGLCSATECNSDILGGICLGWMYSDGKMYKVQGSASAQVGGSYKPIFSCFAYMHLGKILQEMGSFSTVSGLPGKHLLKRRHRRNRLNPKARPSGPLTQ